MLERLDNYDWSEAFAFGQNATAVSVEPMQCKGFDETNVTEILAISDGENDGPDWVGVFKLNDGRYAHLSAGCDYTGWDCRCGGFSVFANDLGNLIRFGLSERVRLRLGMRLPEDYQDSRYNPDMIRTIEQFVDDYVSGKIDLTTGEFKTAKIEEEPETIVSNDKLIEDLIEDLVRGYRVSDTVTFYREDDELYINVDGLRYITTTDEQFANMALDQFGIKPLKN